MTATEELRRILNERGVKWIHGRLSSESTAWLDGDMAVVANEYGDGLLLVERKMTPEQAVEATLGRGTCRLVRRGNLTDWPEMVCWSCSVCGFGWRHDVNDKQFSYCPNCGRAVIDA